VRCHRLVPIGLVVAAMGGAAAPAGAAAPGWSKPHTVSPSFSVGTYAAGGSTQFVQLFGTGATQTRTAQTRAIKSDATQGTAVGVNAGAPGFDAPTLSVNPSGTLVAAWTLDTQGTGPIGLAAARGARAGLPRAATVLPTDGQNVTDVATAIDVQGNATVAWIQETTGVQTVKAATLRAGQAPQVAPLSARPNVALQQLSVGLDATGKATVTWLAGPAGGQPTSIDIARGDGTGNFFPVLEQQLSSAPIDTLQTFETGNGSLIALWLEGALSSGPGTVKSATAPAGGAFGAAKTLVSATVAGAVRFAANASGRAAVLLPAKSGSGKALRVVLRSSSGAWGSTRTLGKAGRTVSAANIAVDSKGRVVALWDDGSAGSPTPTRVLSARTSSSSDPLGDYNQVSQQSADQRCNKPQLFLSPSGDGLGYWQCSTSSSGSIGKPRLARLTAPSSG
jgi:hypothetical protein